MNRLVARKRRDEEVVIVDPGKGHHGVLNGVLGDLAWIDTVGFTIAKKDWLRRRIVTTRARNDTATNSRTPLNRWLKLLARLLHDCREVDHERQVV
jgi:hypothetical protein